jgi:hypothetical protein
VTVQHRSSMQQKVTCSTWHVTSLGAHRLHSLHSAALGFWRVPGTVARKRSALRHALLKGNHAAGHHYEGKEPEVYDAAVAVATQIMSAGQHMPCR